MIFVKDYDPYAWDVNLGRQDWTSSTGKKISYWASNCEEDARSLTQTEPFITSCHSEVTFVNKCNTAGHNDPEMPSDASRDCLGNINRCQVQYLMFLKDLDECAGDHGCQANSVCENIDGGYNCICDDGFSGNALSGEVGCTGTTLII